jgi:putative hydrolase of the HAD superfamily
MHRDAAPVRAVFFDIDDTLVDHTAAMGVATRALFASLSLDESFDAFHQRWKAAHARHYPRFLRGELSYAASARARARDAIDAAMTDEAADALFEKYLAVYERGWTLFPDVLPCLDSLRHVRLGIISNGRADEQTRKLKRLDVDQRFEIVCVSEDVGAAKPSPRIFEHACRLAGIAPNEALYVGDQYELDACAARAAGIRSVWLNRRGATPVVLDGIPSIESLHALRATAGV